LKRTGLVGLGILLVGVGLLAGADSVADVPLFSQGMSPIVTGKAARSQDCVRCHKGVASEWSGSQHATAATDPIFSASWKNWSKAWCLNCHMPLAQDQFDAFSGIPEPAHLIAPRALHGEGVGCVACHVRDGQVLTAGRPSLLGGLFHALREEPELGESRFCAGCHQFNFQKHTPSMPFRYGEEPLQNTFAEWERSGAAKDGLRCQDCHMPEGAHTFPGAHSQALLSSSLSVQARLSAQGLELTVSAAGVGHRVPTGDPFRKLIVEIIEGEEVVYTHSLRRVHSRTEESWALREDTTLPTPESGLNTSRTWTLAIPGDPEGWRLWMVYGDERFEPELEAHQVRQLVARGLVER
jgi:hypothetical protein